MHPVAMYRHNTLEWILAREHQIRPVFSTRLPWFMCCAVGRVWRVSCGVCGACALKIDATGVGVGAVVSRLDMPTSGLVVIPRTPEMARTLRDQLTAHRVAKKYYARVVGRFPTYRVVLRRVCRARVLSCVCRACRRADDVFLIAVRRKSVRCRCSTRASGELRKPR
jgi:hypothetical protein